MERPHGQHGGGHHNAAFTRIIDLRPSIERINTIFIILEKGKPDKVADHASTPICYALVADQTASVNLQLWGDEVDAFQSGDIVKLTGGYFTFHKSAMFLKAGRRGRIERMGEFCMLFTETPNLSRVQWQTDTKTNQLAPMIEPHLLHPQ
mmetsp:Transcript_1547/g.2669  ORF Transcript_1547/g.2669 Transcript_1547/m.2669 type:complete len:150 (-) Transcript_1547:422-871(-)